MSTFYATFKDVRAARNLIEELLRDGVQSDDISLIANRAIDQPTGKTLRDEDGAIREVVGSVGDATAFVGRDDDPRVDDLVPPSNDFTEFSMNERSDIGGGISTVDKAKDVDSVDQMDDSQEEANRMIYPRGEVSYSEHERDDINLALHTGFPTSVPIIEDQVIDDETPVQDQRVDSLETIIVPGFGTVVGGGSLATAALDFINPEGTANADALIAHLRDEGVPETRARVYRDAFEQGAAVLAVVITPGEVDEEGLERAADRHGCENPALFDAPRYYNDGGSRPETGGGNS